ATQLLSADFDHDGRLDLVAVVGNRILLMQNDGEGKFRAPVVVAEAVSNIALGDFDSDGNLDIAVATTFSGIVEILPGHGDGTFAEAIPLTSSLPTIVDLAAGDFDGNGTTDLAVLLGSDIDVHLQYRGVLQPPVRSPVLPSYFL